MIFDPTMADFASTDQTSELMHSLSIELENMMMESIDATELFSSTQFGSRNGVELPRFQNLSSLDGLWNDWDYSQFFSKGKDTLHGNEVYYGDASQQGYGIGPFGSIMSSSSSVPSLRHDNNNQDTQHHQAMQNATFPFIDTVPQMDTANNLNTSRFFNISINGNNESLFLNQSQQNPLLTLNDSYKRSALFERNSHTQNSGCVFEGSSFDMPAFSNNFVRSTASNSLSTIIPNFDLSKNMNPHLAFQPLNGYNASRSEARDIMNVMYPTNLIHEHCGGYKSDMHERQIKNRWGLNIEKYKPRNRRHGKRYYGHKNKNFDGLSALKKGPRELHLQYYTGPLSSLRLATNGQSLLGSIVNPAFVPNIEQYNRADFCEVYSHAKFFVIKSYSEDDVHKSIKYSVWASTTNGNKKLDAAYKEARGKSVECPVFLFFSVNASGHFIGVAEMISPIDFDKTVDYWQQDKWNGCFSLKWHIVKDVPNYILKHIKIESNDNKPVTNSRDTQELKFDQGLQMLNIFKGHISMSSILDDFGFYEARQNFMMEKKSKQQLCKSIFETKSDKVIDVKDDCDFIAKPSEPTPIYDKHQIG